MTNVSIFQGTRMGRKVNSVEEVLEEMRNLPKESKECAQVEIAQQKTPSLIPVTTDTGYFIAPGRFNVGRILESRSYFAFLDLELPMGFWRELRLAKDIGKEAKNIKGWAKVTLDSQPAGVMPVDIRYGLSAVCFRYREYRKFEVTVQKIWDCLNNDAQAYLPVNSNLITYDGENGDIIHVGTGWAQGHPFQTSYFLPIAGHDFEISQAALDKEPDLGESLVGLLGENDPQRAKEVLEWTIGAGPAIFSRGSFVFHERVVVIGAQSQGINGIFADWSADTPHLARMIQANQKDYQKK